MSTLQDKTTLKLKVVSNYNIEKYHQQVQEFWTGKVMVENIQFSTCIDEDGDVHYSTQFIYTDI